MNKNLLTLFKTEILDDKIILNDEKEFNEKIEVLKKQKPRFRSNLSGFQSEDLNLSENIYFYLISQINILSNQLSSHYRFNRFLAVKNMWLNINKYKDSNASHFHPDSIFSGVYYLNVPENSGAIVFKNPTFSYMTLYWPDHIVDNFNSLNSSIWRINPYKNQILIFPSWLEHMVEPSLNLNEERITLSFNVR
jgi:uncharacterized protein (TIGR02466 family)